MNNQYLKNDKNKWELNFLTYPLIIKKMRVNNSFFNPLVLFELKLKFNNARYYEKSHKLYSDC